MPSPVAAPASPAPGAPRRRLRTIAGLLAATVALAGCGLFGSDDAAAPASTTSSTTSTTAAPEARSEPPVLIDAGAEPRQALRVAYTEGDEATITFTSDLEITQETEGRTQRIDSPPIAQTLTYTVGAVTDAGAELTIHLDSIAAKGRGTGLSDDEVAAIDEDLAPLEGLEGTATATPLGEVEDLTFAVPDDLPEDLAAQIDALQEQLPSLGPALPADEVGVGASWRTTGTAITGGAEVATVSTITLTAIGDGTIEYRSEIQTSAEPQPIALDGLADGTTARLEAADLQGTATGTMGLDHVELVLRTQLSGTQQLTLTTGGTTTDLAQTVELAYVAAPATN